MKTYKIQLTNNIFDHDFTVDFALEFGNVGMRMFFVMANNEVYLDDNVWGVKTDKTAEWVPLPTQINTQLTKAAKLVIIIDNNGNASVRKGSAELTPEYLTWLSIKAKDVLFCKR